MRSRFTLLAATAALLAACASPTDQTVPGAQGAPATTAAPPPTAAPAPPPTTRSATPPPGLEILAVRQRKPAPGLSVTSFDGQTVTLAGFRGQPVVVNFFESW